MLEAIHKITKERISAFKLIHDLKWHGKEREEFIAPSEFIDNWEELISNGIEEVKVSFVVRHKRYEGTEQEEIVREHFRIETEKAIENKLSESEEHKLAKKYIYDNLENIRFINFDNKNVFEISEISDVIIEKGLSNYKRADVLVKFKSWHPIFGAGICFEVQISPQKEYETIERTYDRASQGYSVIWIWSRDLPNFKNKAVIDTFQEALKEYQLEIKKIQDSGFREIAVKVDEFSNEQRLKMLKVVQFNEKLKDEVQELKFNRIEETINSKVKEEINKINISEMTEKAVISIIDQVKGRVEQRLALDVPAIINNIFTASLKEKLTKELNTVELKKRIDEIIWDKILVSRKELESKKGVLKEGYSLDWSTQCKKCGSYNCHAYADVIVCFDCKNKEVNNGKVESQIS